MTNSTSLCYVYNTNIIPNIILSWFKTKVWSHKAIIIVFNSSIIGFIFKHWKNKCCSVYVLFLQKCQSPFDFPIFCNLLSVYTIKWMHFHWNWIIFCLQLTKLRFFQTTSHMTFLLYINSHLFWHFGSTVLFNSFGEKKLTSLCWIILFLLSQINRLLSIYNLHFLLFV